MYHIKNGILSDEAYAAIDILLPGDSISCVEDETSYVYLVSKDEDFDQEKDINNDVYISLYKDFNDYSNGKDMGNTDAISVYSLSANRNLREYEFTYLDKSVCELKTFKVADLIEPSTSLS